MKMRKVCLLASALLSSLIIGTSAYAFGEVNLPTEISASLDAVNTEAYETWRTNQWTGKAAANTGNLVLTPGEDANHMNFSWYSKEKGTPGIRYGIYVGMQIYNSATGTATSINRNNGTSIYKGANKVSIGNLTDNTTYYYQYCDDITASQPVWSDTFYFTTHNSGKYQIALVGDVQIGASGTIAADTYSWNETTKQIAKTAKDACFILSAGDQINFKDDTADTKYERERQYAGLLYPELLRRLPFATAIGNHESAGKDYQYHYNLPNSAEQYGKTPSGGGYYFQYGDALYIVLNSNCRDMSQQKQLMNQAVNTYSGAKWRIVMMHHDIYGSGVTHSYGSSANTRILFAPLMDEFDVDLVFSGHDHSYCRSYYMYDGIALTDYGKHVVNPEGTLYISLGTSTGSKMYGLANPKQYYVAERSNNTIATFSTLDVTSTKLVLKTYDSTGAQYAEDVTIEKTEPGLDLKRPLEEAKTKKKTSFTKKSFLAMTRAITRFEKYFPETKEDSGYTKLTNNFGKTTDPVSASGNAQTGYKNTTYVKMLKKGFSTLLDKTTTTKIQANATRVFTLRQNLIDTKNALVKTKLFVKNGSKRIKAGKVLKLKKGKKIKLKVTKTPSSSKVYFKSANKKYVSVSGKGVLKVKVKSKKKIKITVKLEYRTLQFYVKSK